MVPTYVRPPPMMMKGQGCYLWDMENRRYLDLTSGIAVNSLGHCDPEIAQIIAEQVQTNRIFYELAGQLLIQCDFIGRDSHPCFEPLS